VNRDPNGVAGAVAIIVTVLAGLFDMQVDDDQAANIGKGLAAAISVAGIFLARRKTWAPDTVAALGPDTVGEPGVLPVPPK